MLNTTAVDEYKLQFDNMCKQSGNNTKCVSKYFDENYRQDKTTQKTVNENNYKVHELIGDTKSKIFSCGLDLQDEIAVCDVIETNNQNSSQDSGIVMKSSQEDVEIKELLNDDEAILSQTIEDKEPFVIEPFFNITPREMPESPHHVVEEDFKNNPWIMLVATIFLTKTSGKVARPLMKNFFEKYPTPLHVLDSEPSQLEEYFVKLGLKKRGTMIWKMSHQFISGKWRRASDLCGIGKYGEDAYRLFCLGHCDIEPTDRYLKLYLDWLKFQTDHTTTWSIEDCEKIITDPVAKYYRISLR